MKKRLLAGFLTAVLAMSLTACGGASEGAGKKETFKIGLVIDVGGVEDQSFNQSAWEGLQRAEEELGVEINYLASYTDSDYAPNIETFIDEDYDLILSVGYMLAEATRTAAESYPDQQFAIVDDSSCADLDNVACLMFKQEQAAYLATKTGVALGSDAFFPFSDNIERAKKSGVSYIAQPGGSIRDDAVIDCCNKYGMVMAFTKMRLFHH